MYILGIDYSITSPAATLYNTATDKYQFFAFRQKKKQSCTGNITLLEMPEYKDEMSRFRGIANALYGAITTVGMPEYAYIEDYAYSASGQITRIVEATMCMKMKLYHVGIPLTTIEPTKAKKIATGKGNAKKRQMVDQFKSEMFDLYELFGEKDEGLEKIPSPISDIIDSYFVLKSGMSLLKI